MRTKTSVNLYLSIDIVNFCRINDINLSGWVDKNFKKQYMQVEEMAKELQELEKRKDELINMMKLIKEQRKNSICVEDVDLLKEMVLKVEKGFDMKAVYRLFCSESYKTISFEEFVTSLKTMRRK